MEIERRGRAAGSAEELHAVFPDERAFLQLFEDAKAFERPVGSRHQRLADLKPWKLLAFEQQDPMTIPGDQRRDRTSCRAAADHNDIVGI